MHFSLVCTTTSRNQNLDKGETKDSLNKKRGKPVILEQLLVLSLRWHELWPYQRAWLIFQCCCQKALGWIFEDFKSTGQRTLVR